MRESLVLPIVLILTAFGVVGCELIADIFRAGVLVGVLLVVGIIGLVVWLISRVGR